MCDSEKSDGTTNTERILYKLCKSTFLSIWSHANVYRDEFHAASGKGDGKEVCDVLIVCGNHVVIFSDKSCTFADTANVDVAWKRWYRRAILKSVDQLIGAHGWILSHPDRVYLDKSCQRKLPGGITVNSDTKFHLVVVASGANGACRTILGGNGGLRICPSIRGNDHFSDNARPFEIGDILPSGQFIHVLDEVSLSAVLKERDTVLDFVQYLTRKEVFIRSDALKLAASELDLLACYMSHVENDGGHGFPAVPPGAQLELLPGYWSDHVRNPQVLRKRDADSISYEWDRLIEHFTHHTQAGTAIAGNVPSIDVAETPLRIMAMETRTNRRGLARAWLDLIQHDIRKGQGKFRTHFSDTRPDVAYVFFCMPRDSSDELAYIKLRSARLRAQLMTLPLRFPELKLTLPPCFKELNWIVGIATEPAGSRRRTFDFAAMETSRMLPEDIEMAQQLLAMQDETRRGPIRQFHSREDEYPDEREDPAAAILETRLEKPGRNAACPCGSGKKYKKCCGLRQ